MFKRFWRRLRGRCGGCGAKREWRQFPRLGAFVRGAWVWHRVCSNLTCAGFYNPQAEWAERHSVAFEAWIKFVKGANNGDT